MSSSTRKVIVDDNDSTIVYSPNWSSESGASKDSQGNFGPTLKSTLHGTNSNGTFQYQFTGTQIEVFGTSNFKNSSSGVQDPSWDCRIDNISIGATAPFNFPENNWLLCSADNLTSGPHTLTVFTFSRSRHFYFDYIRYTPSNPSDFSDALVMISPGDPDIVYDNSWQSLGNIANMTTVTGSTATVNFTGVAATWYGIVPSELPIASARGTYSIDGTPAQPFTLAGLQPNAVTQFNQVFIETPTLPPGPHSMTVVFDGSQNSTPLTLQYLIIQNSTRSLLPPAASSSFSGPTATAAINRLEVGDKKKNVAAIVCGVLFPVLILCLSLFFYLKYVRGKKRANSPLWENIVKPFSISRGPHRIVESASMSTIGLFGPRDEPNPSQPRPVSGYTIPTRTRRRSVVRITPNQYPLPEAPTLQPAPQPKPKLKPILTSFNDQGQPQASGSRPPRRSKKKEPPEEPVKDLDENASYYGGYQTWGQTKALEAASGARARDSYI